MDIPPNGQYKAELSGGPKQGEIVTLTANGTELLPEFVAELKDGSHVHYVLDGATQVFNALTVSYVYADELDLNKPEILYNIHFERATVAGSHDGLTAGANVTQRTINGKLPSILVDPKDANDVPVLGRWKLIDQIEKQRQGVYELDDLSADA